MKHWTGTRSRKKDKAIFLENDGKKYSIAFSRQSNKTIKSNTKLVLVSREPLLYIKFNKPNKKNVYEINLFKQFNQLFSVSSYSKSRIKLQNLQISTKMLEKSSQFFSSEQPCELKSLDIALNIAGVEKIPSKNLWLWST